MCGERVCVCVCEFAGDSCSKCMACASPGPRVSPGCVIYDVSPSQYMMKMAVARVLFIVAVINARTHAHTHEPGQPNTLSGGPRTAMILGRDKLHQEYNNAHVSPFGPRHADVSHFMRAPERAERPRNLANNFAPGYSAPQFFAIRRGAHTHAEYTHDEHKKNTHTHSRQRASAKRTIVCVSRPGRSHSPPHFGVPPSRTFRVKSRV